MASDLRKGLPRPSIKGPGAKNVPNYYLVVEELDELFEALATKYPLSPEWLRHDMLEGLTIYKRENLHRV